MNIQEIKAMVDGSQYDFLRTNEHLRGKIMFLTLGGSYAYGTNVETSDVDVRGCAANSASDLLGLSNFEQVIDRGTDTTVYAFNKLIGMLVNCNPNVIEMLGCKPEHYFYVSDSGKQLIDNRRLFLSRRAVNSFGGFANQMLRKLENGLSSDGKLQQEKLEEYTMKSIKSAVYAFNDRRPYIDKEAIKLRLADSPREGLSKEVVVDFNLKGYPARDLNSIMNEMTNVLGTYEKLGGRNTKKDDAHLNKHAMHLVRLYLMCFDILEKGDICTYRESDRDMLLDIRNGKYQKPDGSYDGEFFEMVNDFEKRLDYAKKNTSLPNKPDMKRVEEMVMDINYGSISGAACEQNWRECD